jgi:ribonuclease HII
MLNTSNFNLYSLKHRADVTCGVDEAGRGALAGPVLASAVILNPEKRIDGLQDSKKLTEKRRQLLAEKIKTNALAWAVAECSETEIDSLNILQATMLAMLRAVDKLAICPTLALIDGNHCPPLNMRSESIIKGDETVPMISAASILAKTTRDSILQSLHKKYPQYELGKHKGYPTALHIDRLRLYGVSPVHRRSYAPIRAMLSGV